MEKPEARQSERSDVCRDRAKGKYLWPEGRAGRREAVVRRAPEAGREPLWGGRERVLIARRGGAQHGTAGDCNREGGRGNTGWRRCTKPVRSDASARPRRLQRRHHPRRLFDLGCGANRAGGAGPCPVAGGMTARKAGAALAPPGAGGRGCLWKENAARGKARAEPVHGAAEMAGNALA